jgi:hypothetical protein
MPSFVAVMAVVIIASVGGLIGACLAAIIFAH